MILLVKLIIQKFKILQTNFKKIKIFKLIKNKIKFKIIRNPYYPKLIINNQTIKQLNK
jgi:hypothetical protein